MTLYKRHIAGLFLISASLLFFSSCGQKESIPAVSSPGIGSKTLMVRARVTANNIFKDGSSDPENYITTFHVDIEKAGEPITDAIVKFSNSTETFTLIQKPADSGRYTNPAPGYNQVYELSVQSGNDYIKNAFCTGPEIHSITYPTVQTSHPTNSDLPVQWNKASNAQNVHIATTYFDSDKQGNPASDTGIYTIPSSSFPSLLSTTFSDVVSVTRGNDVDLSVSGAEGSILIVEVENSVRFTLTQQ